MDKNYSVDDFTIIAQVGKATQGGKVYLVKERATKEIYTLKTIKKSKVQEKSKAHYIFSERSLLIELSHPFVIKLKSTFQNQTKLYFLLEHCPGGDLSSLLKRAHTLSEDQAKFYAAQMLLALEYLHSRNVVYRDLKPENILIDQEGYIRVTDFGISKKTANLESDKHSIYGNLEYMPPEVLREDQSGKAIDYWALGCLIHQMISGLPPFYSQNQGQMIENIKYKPLRFEADMSHNCQVLLQGLLKKDPKSRLGSQGIDQIKQSGWFSIINWDAILNKKIAAPFLPQINSKSDFTYFNREFTEAKETFTESLANQSLSGGNAFSGFTYAGSLENKGQI